MPRIRRLPEATLENIIRDVSRELNSIKEAQAMGLNNTQVRTTTTTNTSDISGTVPSGSGYYKIGVYFTQAVQTNGFFDLRFIYKKNGTKVTNADVKILSNTSMASNTTTASKVLLLLQGGSSYTYDFKFYVNATDTGTISWAVL